MVYYAVCVCQDMQCIRRLYYSVWKKNSGIIMTLILIASLYINGQYCDDKKKSDPEWQKERSKCLGSVSFIGWPSRHGRGMLNYSNYCPTWLRLICLQHSTTVDSCLSLIKQELWYLPPTGCRLLSAGLLRKWRRNFLCPTFLKN